MPHLHHMSQKVGGKIPRVFDKVDMTKGYYQLFIAEKVKAYTAFITFMDIFEWIRIPMGFKASASYFQAQMAKTVLARLVYIICKVYVDDILVHA